MTDIAFVRKVLEFVENEHSDFKHEQGLFVMTPEIAKHQLRRDGAVFMADGDEMGEFEARFGVDCKTAACIAGTACLLDPDVTIDHDGEPVVDGKVVRWDDHAQKLLGLPDDTL